MPPLAESGMLRMSLADAGSVNFGTYDSNGLPMGNFVYRNSFDDVHHMFEPATATRRPSLAVFDPSFVRAILAWHDAGRLPAGSMVKLYFGGDTGYLGGLAFGLPPIETALDAYTELLQPSGLPWSASVFGGDVVATGFREGGLDRGGHLHLGLSSARRPPPAHQRRARGRGRRLCEESGRPVATPDQAADLLGLRSRSETRVLARVSDPRTRISEGLGDSLA